MRACGTWMTDAALRLRTHSSSASGLFGVRGIMSSDAGRAVDLLPIVNLAFIVCGWGGLRE